jgi:N-acyl amino acid synthase of PEP-CTERM/exosortase system
MALETQQDLVSSYADHFTVMRADTPALLDEAFRLRYQVYCLENSGFEDPGEHQDGRERDSDDDRSVHALLVHKRTGVYAGTVRVILPSRHATPPLPIHGLIEAQNKKLLSHFPPACDLAEISRFAVSKEFRRRRGDQRFADAGWPESSSANDSDERRALPFITFGLIGAVLEICREHRVLWIAAVMEPALIRIFQRLGINFERLGEPVEHHGMRWCCVARLADLVSHGHAHETLLSHYTRQSAGQPSARPPRAIAAAA